MRILFHTRLCDDRRPAVELHSRRVADGIEYERIGAGPFTAARKGRLGGSAMKSRRMPVMIGLAVLGLTATAVGTTGRTVGAAGPTACTIEADYTLSPGLSSTTPSSGSFSTNGETGTLTCNGPVNGRPPTGPGTIGVSGHYGTKGGETCQSGGGGDYTMAYTIPTSSGPQHVTDNGTFTYGGIQAGVLSGQFQGARMTGTFQVRPTQGDCVTSPMTKLHQSAKSTLR
jgi:hypothetical protein